MLLGLPEDESVDVYATGLVLWQLFAANAVDKAAPASVVTKQSRPPLPSDMPQQLRTLLCRCWHQQPVLRPTSQQLHSELQQLAGTHAKRLQAAGKAQGPSGRE